MYNKSNCDKFEQAFGLPKHIQLTNDGGKARLTALYADEVLKDVEANYASLRALMEFSAGAPSIPLNKGTSMNTSASSGFEPATSSSNPGTTVYRYTNKLHPKYNGQKVVFKTPSDNLGKSGRTTGRILVALGTAIQQGTAVLYDHQGGYTNMSELAAHVLITANALGLKYIVCRPQQTLGRVAIRCEIIDVD